MKILFLTGVWMLSFICGISAQDADIANDYLSPAFHASRRDSARARMPANSVMVVFAFPTRNFSNDVDYVYHANPDLYYFTGYKEPHSVLFLFKEDQKGINGSNYNELLFVQERNERAEQWTGKRLGVEGVKRQLKISQVFNGKEFRIHQQDFAGFESVIMDRLPLADPAGDRDSADLYNLVKQFSAKAGLQQAENKRVDFQLYRKITGALREIKTDEEMALLRKAIEISCIGQAEVMKAIRPEMSE
ncbi:MAG: aminopeptidase P family protein, partial [Sphingobacteriales bacterium]